MSMLSETVNKEEVNSNNRTEEKLIMDYLTIEVEDRGKNYRNKHGVETRGK